MKIWYPEIDIIKAVAILLIVFSHMDNYLFNYHTIRNFDNYTAMIGLSFFFFIAGFLLSQHDWVIGSITSIKQFYLKKFKRIYPLYWIALISLIIIFGIFSVNPGNVAPYDFSLDNLIINFFGLQGIFPEFSLQSMWFVGVIILFFLLYPIIMRYSKNLKDILITSAIFFFLFLMIHVFSGLISINFLIYFPIFISGIFTNRLSIIENCNSHAILGFFAIICTCIISMILMNKIFNFNIYAVNQLIQIIILISLCNLSLIIVKKYVKFDAFIMSIISSIAMGTYAIYLFQHQFLSVFASIIHLIIPNIIIQDILVITIGFAGAITFGVVVQRLENSFFFKRNSLI